jgi:hypothetical protein
MVDRKIILLELNEVPFRIFDYYCRHHPRSAFATKLPRCRQLETYASDSNLSPWITWPSVHRGVTDDQHSIHHFGQDLSTIDRAFPPIWHILAAHGVSTGVFGSLQTYPLPTQLENYSFYVPDTFAAGSECFPATIEAYQEFNLAMCRDSGRNVGRKIPWRSALDLLLRMPDLGFKVATLADTARQVASEWIKPTLRVRRRTYQTVFAFDVFMNLLQKTRPAFATFFTNHVASSMHRYWAALFPEDYTTVGYDNEWINTYRSEIDFTMSKFDALFARLISFIDYHPEYTLWVATSMGQAATSAEPLETQLYVTNLSRFMAAFGLGPEDWTRRPAMEPDVSIFVVPNKLSEFLRLFQTLRIDGNPVQYEEHAEGFIHFALGHGNLHRKPLFAILDGREVSFEDLGLEATQIEDMTGTNAYHIPEGCLLIYDPRESFSKLGRTSISTLDIAPAILRNFSIPVPTYMQAPAHLTVRGA